MRGKLKSGEKFGSFQRNTYLCIRETTKLKGMCTYNITLNDELVKQTRSSFANEDAMDKWLQQQIEMILSDFNTKQMIRENARKAIDAMRLQSEQNGNSKMSLDEINSEIRETRSVRKVMA